MSRFARFAANVRFNLYGQLIQAALPLFFVPFILRYLGQGAYSLYALIGVLTSQLNLLSFGAGPATVKYLAEFESAGDSDRVNRLVSNSLLFYGGIGLLGAGIILGFAPLFENRWLHIPPGLESAAHFIFLCAAGVYVIQSSARTFHAIPQALQRFDLWNSAEVATSLFLYAGIYVLLKRGWWVRGLAAWTVAAAIFNLGLYAFIGPRLIPTFSPRPAYEPEMMRKIRSFGGWLFAGQVSWSIMFQMDKLVLGSFVPLTDLTYYLIAFNLSQKLPLFLYPVLPILLPFSSALHGRRDYDTARKLYISGTKLTVVAVLPAAILAFFFAPTFLELWLGGHYSEHAGWVLRVLIVGMFMNALTSLGSSIAQGFGRVRTMTIIGISTFAAGAASWFVLMPRYGILGAAWAFCGTVTANALLLTIWCNRRLLEVSTRRFAGAFFRPGLISLPLIAVSFILRNSLKNWFTLGGYGAVAYIGYLGGCYLFGLNSEERHRVSNLMTRSPA